MKNLISKMSLQEKFSILTTLIASIGILYLNIADIWHLPLGKQVSDTCYALVTMISSVLGAITMKKVSNKNDIFK